MGWFVSFKSSEAAFSRISDSTIVGGPRIEGQEMLKWSFIEHISRNSKRLLWVADGESSWQSSIPGEGEFGRFDSHWTGTVGPKPRMPPSSGLGGGADFCSGEIEEVRTLRPVAWVHVLALWGQFGGKTNRGGFHIL